MRYDLRVTAPYQEVAAALQELVDGGVLEAHSPAARVSFGLRPAGGGDAVDVLLLIDGDVDDLAGVTVANALRRVGFHVDESSYDREDEGDRAFETVQDALEPQPSVTAADPADPEQPLPDSPEPV